LCAIASDISCNDCLTKKKPSYQAPAKFSYIHFTVLYSNFEVGYKQEMFVKILLYFHKNLINKKEATRNGLFFIQLF